MDEITNTVKSASDGTVKITVEKYQELMTAAAEKAPIIYNTTQKTQAMVAADNKMWGLVFIGGGVAMSLLGTGMHFLGRAQAKALIDEIAAQ